METTNQNFVDIACCDTVQMNNGQTPKKMTLRGNNIGTSEDHVRRRRQDQISI
jgi:hypothetical protein